MSLAIEPTSDQQEVRKRVFPLNLTPFEEYMIWDDRPDYPMTFVVQLRLEGDLDREAIENALPLALRRHPLLQAVIGRGKGGREGWVAAKDPTIHIDWGGLESPIRPEQEAIDLRQRPGLRIWIRHDEEQAVITTQFHHACCDGIGSYEFIGDWLWHYSRLMGFAGEESLPEFEPSALRSRVSTSYHPENFRDSQGRYDRWSTIKFSLMCVSNKLKLSPSQPKHRAVHETKTLADEIFPGIRERELDKAQFKATRHKALDRGQSINELLIEKLLTTMRQWNELQGRKKSGQFCVMMPMDLREPETRIGSAANLVTYSLIRRDAKDCVASQSLSDSLREEMLHIKKSRHRTLFMNMLAGTRRLPRKILRAFTRSRVLATAILSNTGDPTKQFNVSLPHHRGVIQVGNLQLASISGVPPMRPGTRMSVSVFTYRKQLRICMRCDPHLFSPADTQQILDLYVEQILDDAS